MAIIKCPECGHQISDKAPVCPSCGVEIAGKITRCPQCGEVYFKDLEMCPNCHHVTLTASSHQQPVQPQPVVPAASVVPPSVEGVRRETTSGPANDTSGLPSNGQQPKKKGHGALILSFVLALIVLAVCFYFYKDAKSSKEREAYEYAMNSSDPLVLQSYLDTYKDADQAHIDSIQAHLTQLKQADLDWTNAVASGSQAALEDYLSKHPNSPHRAEVQHKIDSLGWLQASNENTLEAYKLYLVDHANGDHVDEANDAIKMLNSKTVQPEEKSAVAAIFRRFFQSINSKDEEALTSTVAPIMTSFLGKSDATRSDVSTFLQKIYKEDITNMNWHLSNDYKIDKKEVGENEYEYAVQFSAIQDIERTDPTKEKTAKYRISAKVGPDGKISAFNLTKILE
ncbi:MAG: zinc ribbon domain-containing protein [Prevotella sp.]|nr:zinc ribbon domain-containing protein [Prevotella sp.]